MPATARIQAKTLDRFIDGWAKWSPDEWLATFSDDLIQVTMPYNMGIPNRGRAEVDQVLPKVMSVVSDYELKIHNIVHDAERNKAAVYASSTGITPFGAWNMEYSAFVTFSDDGSKIAKIEEMLDSAAMKELAPKLHNYMKQQSVQA